MKKIDEKTTKINFEKFQAIHKNTIKQTVKKQVQEALDTIPENILKREKRRWIGITGWILIPTAIAFAIFFPFLVYFYPILILFLAIIIIILGMVLIFLGRSTKKAIKKHINKTIKEEKIYGYVFDSFEDIKFLSHSHEIMENLENKKIDFKIPSFAWSIGLSPALTIKYKNKYEISFQSVHWFWYEGAGRSIRARDKWMGILQINTFQDEKFVNFDFSINKKEKAFAKLKKSNKVVLENKAFSKKYKLQSNDKIKIRQILTPLAMEKLEKYISQLNLTNWNITKENDYIFIPFTTKYENLLLLSFDSKTKDSEVISEQITQNIIEDCYFMHSIINIVNQMPMLDDFKNEND